MARYITEMGKIAVLFARSDSIYKQMTDCDVFDIGRDARTFSGGMPVVAHPPCRAWGRLRQFANPRHDEKELALFAVDQVRKCGGVLEHPERSTLWIEKGLPLPGQRDEFGGWTLPVHQWQWGHKAQKATWLYICGVMPHELPVMPLRLGEAEFVIKSSKKQKRPEVTKKEREATPPDFALWLVDLASRCQVHQVKH